MKLRVLLISLVAALLLAVPTAALADGDPGSDVLLVQSSYLPAATNLTVPQELQIGRLLSATERAGAPIRIAVIPQRAYLGTVTQFWGSPQTYANYLGTELRDNYSGRLLVIMPGGFGYYWGARERRAVGPDAMATALANGHVRVQGVSGGKLEATVKDVVAGLEAAAGVSSAKLASELKAVGDNVGTGPLAASSSSGAGGQQQAANASAAQSGSGAHANRNPHKFPTGVYGLVVILLGLLYITWRTGKLKVLIKSIRTPTTYVKRRDSEDCEGKRKGLFGLGISPFALVPSIFLVIVVIIVAVGAGGSGSGSSQSQRDLAEANNGLPVAQNLGDVRTAPNFTLYDQTGRKVSLSDYRGKVVILSFVDDECQTICPLTTQAMLDAKRSLGAAGKDVVLLGVNVNWRSNQVQDVLTYSQLHGMLGHWNFLTGSLPQLERVWNNYKVDEYKYYREEKSSNIDHVAQTYVISPQGKERWTFVSSNNYSDIPAFGQEMATAAASLLPSHPVVSTHYSYKAVPGIGPGQTATLPEYGGGSAQLGPGHAHLYVFFDTWDVTYGLTRNLEALNQYADAAKADGLPPLTAIDEGSVEPNSGALPAFMRTLPAKLRYPVAIDSSGRVADGYNVEGEPWFVLTSPSGKIVWYQEVYTAGWPSLKVLAPELKSALKRTTTAVPSPSSAKSQLQGSPPALAKLHQQASQILPGNQTALAARIKALHGYPVVVNIWGSWCPPCQKEFKYFQQASAQYGKNVAFLGADYNDVAGNARLFLKQHPVWYPSYTAPQGSLTNLLPGGVEGTPTTIFYNAAGRQTKVYVDKFSSAGALDFYIQHYALGLSG